MDDRERFSQGGPQTLAICPIGRSRQGHQILHVPDQMGQTKLNEYPAFAHIPAVRRKVIAAEHAIEFLAQYLHQHVGAAGWIDFDNSVQARVKTPGPPLLAIFAVTCLIHIQHRSRREILQERFIGSIQCFTDFANDLGQMTTGNDRQLLPARLRPLLQRREGRSLLEVLEMDRLVQNAHQRLRFANARTGVLLSRGFGVHAKINAKNHEPKCQLPIHVRSSGYVSWAATNRDQPFPPNDTTQRPRPLARQNASESRNAAAVGCSDWFGGAYADTVNGYETSGAAIDPGHAAWPPI